MKKVLVFGITDNPGGIESVIMNYYRFFDRKKIQLDFLCNTKTVAYEDEIIKLGGNIYRVTARSKNPKRFKKEMDSFFKEKAKEYDSIWVNVCSLANIDYLKYAKKYNIKKRIIHCHNSQNMDSFLRGIMHRFNRFFIKKYATDFWSCSSKASKWFYSEKIMKSNKYRLVNNAIPIKKFIYNSKVRENYRNNNKLHDKLVLCNVGRLHFQKNQEFLIEVFYEILKKNKDAMLLLVGDGEDRIKIETKIKNLNLIENVKLLGLQKDVSSILQGSDIFIMPSLFEGLSLSLLEAEASGLPVFVSDSISDESKMSEYYYKISLNLAPAKWADIILNQYKNVPQREKRTNSIKKNGFDIELEAKNIEKYL